MTKNILNIVILSAFALFFSSCTRADDNFTGIEYAPNMYHSVPYEPLSQIDDVDAGSWKTSKKNDSLAEFYSMNPYNPYGMSMRLPVKGTVHRGTVKEYDSVYIHKNNIPKDSFDIASRQLKNPFEATDANIADGKYLYTQVCQPCHGAEGNGKGKVGEVYGGVPAYNAPGKKDLSEGHIYHVITHGKGRMWPHASQLSPEERWKVILYVQTLQKK